MYARCESCNKKLSGEDTVLVDNTSTCETIFCSEKCQARHYRELNGKDFKPKKCEVMTINQYWGSWKNGKKG